MTVLEELQNFAEALAPVCTTNRFRFACLKSEQDFELAPRLARAPYLYLAHVSEELVAGHIIATAEGRTLFIRVRTPLAASTTLKFVTLRTYSLILAQQRALNLARYQRRLSLPAAPSDLQQM